MICQKYGRSRGGETRTCNLPCCKCHKITAQATYGKKWVGRNGSSGLSFIWRPRSLSLKIRVHIYDIARATVAKSLYMNYLFLIYMLFSCGKGLLWETRPTVLRLLGLCAGAPSALLLIIQDKKTTIRSYLMH